MSVQALLAIKSIQYYQKYLSPGKGYSCAYRVLHDDLSCSTFCKNEIEQQGVLRGIINTIKRFKECKAASLMIKEKRNDLKDKLGDSFKENTDKCKNLDSFEKLLFAEMAGETACCICLGVS